jgi:small subunit ribosomal protein S10
MNSKARIKLSSVEPDELNSICEQIKSITKRAGVDIKGPIPLPTKRLRMSTRKAPSGEGRETYETWELRIHKRIIDMDADERALRHIMRIQVPKAVNMEMEITE